MSITETPAGAQGTETTYPELVADCRAKFNRIRDYSALAAICLKEVHALSDHELFAMIPNIPNLIHQEVPKYHSLRTATEILVACAVQGEIGNQLDQEQVYGSANPDDENFDPSLAVVDEAMPSYRGGDFEYPVPMCRCESQRLVR